MYMPSTPMGLTQMGNLLHSYFDQPLRRSSNMDDSQAQAKDDEHDHDADIQDLESTDPSGQVIGIGEV
jgi:hypothetical protein